MRGEVLLRLVFVVSRSGHFTSGGRTEWERASQLSAPGLVRQLVGTRCKDGWVIATVGRGKRINDDGPIWQLARNHERGLINLINLAS